MNGFSGLEAVSGNGKKLWSASMANVWSQAIVRQSFNRTALVLASDASGSVNVFDSAGNRQGSLRPEGGYFMAMTAGAAESNTVQILGFSGNAAVAFDQTGKVAWVTSAQSGVARQSAVMG